MLRDIGKIAGFRVEWDKETKTAHLTQDELSKNLSELSTAKPAKRIVKTKQTIVCGDFSYKDIFCLNIDGYNYFKLRDLVDIMEFSCYWDEETKTVKIALDNKDFTVDINPEKLLIPGEDRRIIEEDVPYVPNSGDYSHIEKYMREHIDPDFKASNYIITEEYYVTVPGSLLDLRLNVNGVPTIDFGYWISCINGKMAVLTFNGEMNPDFDSEKAPYPKLSDEEAKRLAIEEDADNQKRVVEQQTVSRYYRMRTLTHQCEVETVYRNENGTSYATRHVFTDKWI